VLGVHLVERGGRWPWGPPALLSPARRGGRVERGDGTLDDRFEAGLVAGSNLLVPGRGRCVIKAHGGGGRDGGRRRSVDGVPMPSE
jgi:hypothetical protein